MFFSNDFFLFLQAGAGESPAPVSPTAETPMQRLPYPLDIFDPALVEKAMEDDRMLNSLIDPQTGSYHQGVTEDQIILAIEYSVSEGHYDAVLEDALNTVYRGNPPVEQWWEDYWDFMDDPVTPGYNLGWLGAWNSGSSDFSSIYDSWAFDNWSSGGGGGVCGVSSG